MTDNQILKKVTAISRDIAPEDQQDEYEQRNWRMDDPEL